LAPEFPSLARERSIMFDFFEFSNEMLCIADSRGYFTRVNPAWTRTLGWSQQELVSRPYIEFVHPDDVQATIREAELLLSGAHETVSFENRYRSQDGRFRWLAWNAKLEPSSNQLVAAARDVTEQKRQAAALRESEERFEAFMSNTPALAWAKDEQGRIVYLNKAYEDRFQIRLEDWRGKTEFDLWPQHVAQQFREDGLKVLAGGVPVTSLERVPTQDMRQTLWMTVRFPYHDSHGSKYLGGIAFDITELRQAEAELRAERELLRNLIEVQEKEKQFLCHEFHDGLIQYAVATLMLLESYRSNCLTTQAPQIVDEAIASLRRGIEDGRRVIRGIRPAVLDDGRLEDALEDLAHQLSTPDFTVTYKCDPEIGKLPQTLATTVYRVVQEALNNARKHSDSQAVIIEVHEESGTLHLNIRDFGRGFEPDSSLQQGFGLRGMSERVRLLGGDLQVRSEPDAGTRILVRLPISEPALEPSDVKAQQT
jgi:PAS domain S-box-containing protein